MSSEILAEIIKRITPCEMTTSDWVDFIISCLPLIPELLFALYLKWKIHELDKLA
jgi:TRAP-type mannitol/chloroaromatic compound transport system permease small subunit